MLAAISCSLASTQRERLHVGSCGVAKYGAAFSGAAVSQWRLRCRRVQLLVTGDAAGLLLFAAIGRLSHGETLGLGWLETAAPFLAGVQPDAARRQTGATAA